MTVGSTAIEIERRLTAIETTLPTLATKADLQAMRAEWKSDLHSLTPRMVTAVLGSVTAAATITGLMVGSSVPEPAQAWVAVSLDCTDDARPVRSNCGAVQLRCQPRKEAAWASTSWYPRASSPTNLTASMSATVQP